MGEMKVVINSCFGGFSLSLEGQIEWAQRKGYSYIVDSVYEDSIDKCVHLTDASTYLDGTLNEWYSTDYGSTLIYDIPRTDPVLVSMVLEDGPKYSGTSADLTVVNIPDDIRWHIEDYDGRETVAENHRTWR
jgi:hypothetical protein